MTKLFIPACGDRITMVEPWEFDLYLESRNMKFAQERKLIDEKKADRWGSYDSHNNLRKVAASLPAGTVLECDRVYIRTFSKGAIQVGNDYDSITWKVMKGEKPAKNQRFWVKLPDVYNIEYKLDPDSLYRDRVKCFKDVHES